MDSSKNTLRGLLDLTIADMMKSPEKPSYTLADFAFGDRSSAVQDKAPRRRGLIADALAAYLEPTPDSEAFIDAVWAKGYPVAAYDPRYIRVDRFGTLMARSQHGSCTVLGWHMDHVIPRSRSGSDLLYNREPLHWRNNLAKSDSLV